MHMFIFVDNFFPSLEDVYMVLLALPSGNEDFRRNVTEKSVWGSENPQNS